MDVNQLKDDIQNSAIEKWVEAGKKGTIESITGSGKNFMFLKALYTMPKDNRETVHLFLAETTEREKDLLLEIVKFNKIFKVSVLDDYNLKFFCYQSVWRFEGKKYGLVCCDEIHDQLTPSYVLFHINNEYEAVLGLSAKINKGALYDLTANDKLKRYFFGMNFVDKIDMIRKVAPICFQYTSSDGQKDGTARKLNIYVIKNSLDERHRNQRAGSSSRPFYQTERDAYDYVNTLFEKALVDTQKEGEDFFEFEDRKKKNIARILTKRNKLLYNLPSKKDIVERIIHAVKGKTILFGNDLDSLELIIPGRVLSSRNDDHKNDLIRKTFEEGKLRTIGSFKKLKQGANLSDVDNEIIKDYYASESDMIQRVGRLRENKGKIGHVFIIVTEGTQEVIWFNKMTENLKDYNYILCNNFKAAIDEYSKVEGLQGCAC